jgi:tetratricopeptide (TPR) repeat protein
MIDKVKKSRKELLHEPDEFMVLSGRLLTFLRTYQQQALYAALGILLILATVAVLRFVSTSNEDKASRLWAQIKSNHQAALQDKVDDPGGAEAAALAAVEADFTKLFDKYGGKQTGKLARLNYAQLCLAAGKADAALPHFEAAVTAFRDDLAWGDLALSGLAHALAQTGAHAKAAARFEEIVAGGAGAYTAEALFQLGWLYTKTGENAKGRKAYERLVVDYPDSSYVEFVGERIARDKVSG